jgi:uncharacterized protein YuzE
VKIKYFDTTDTALLEFSDTHASETRELSEDIYLDLNDQGHVVSITIEHASLRGNISEISFLRMNEKCGKELATST